MYYHHPPHPPGWGYGHGPTTPVYPTNQQQFIPVPPYNGYTPYATHPPAPPFTVDSSGWHIPTPQQRSAPPTPGESYHAYWKGRFAPFPGHASKPGLFPLPDTRTTITLKKPSPTKLIVSPSNQLLPPQSFMISPQSTTAPLASSEETLVEPTESFKQEFQLDKYADPFTPQYLKIIQKKPHMLIPLAPIPIFPSFHYLRSFLPQTLIENPPISTILSSPPVTDECPPLQLESYTEHWVTLLGWELESLCLEKEQIVLYKIAVQVSNWAESKFIIHVPGIRENHPRLEIGDLVHLREVDERNCRGTDRAFEGRVSMMVKREGYVHFVSPTLRDHIRAAIPNKKAVDGSYATDDTLPFSYNVSFLLNALPVMAMESAVLMMGSSLQIDPAKNNVARHWLFPDPEDLPEVDGVHSLGSHIEQEHWYDHGLNAEQRLAVSSISLRQSPVPYLISGPPGTGKTRTVVEAVLQVLRVQPEACIVLCAPSNPATDTLAQRLATHLKPSEMLRLNDPSRTFAEVPQEIFHYCYVEDGKFALPPWPALMKFRVVVCSCLDASILKAAHCTNAGLAILEQNIVNALHPHRRAKHQGTPHWTHLLIDEAAQGSEPELLVPISIVHTRSPQSEGSQDSSTGLPHGPQLVLCGDINQLGPIISSERARNSELHLSLLERLFDRQLYKEHPQARKMLNLVRTRRKSLNDLPSSFVPFASLIKNYRSHPGILMPPSTLFYNDTLEPQATNGVVKWSDMPNPDLPLVFFGHEAKEDCLDERVTWFNNWEIDKIVDIIKSLMREGESSSPPLSATEIGVMAPWRAQVWNLRHKLREASLAAVDVGTVEDYQGRERRIIIISCVRSSPRFVPEDNKKAMGVIFEKKRMNVAITRAKELLIIVGNGSVLKQDPYWGGLLQFAIRNKLYTGPHLDIEMDGNYVSRLETVYLDSCNEKPDEEDRGFVLAGGMAREVLNDG